MKQSEMASSLNSKWESIKERPNRSTKIWQKELNVLWVTDTHTCLLEIPRWIPRYFYIFYYRCFRCEHNKQKKTRMTTFIKTKFKISDHQTHIDMYRLAANITEYHIISKLILQRIIITNFCGLRVIWGKVQYRIFNPHQISKWKIKYWNRSRNNEIMLQLKIPKSSCLK